MKKMILAGFASLLLATGVYARSFTPEEDTPPLPFYIGIETLEMFDEPAVPDMPEDPLFEYEFVIMGESLDEEIVEEKPTPPEGFYFKVERIVPFVDFTRDLEACFVVVKPVLIEAGATIPLDKDGVTYAYDLDGVFKPDVEIAVDMTDCSSPSANMDAE